MVSRRRRPLDVAEFCIPEWLHLVLVLALVLAVDFWIEIHVPTRHSGYRRAGHRCAFA